MGVQIDCCRQCTAETGRHLGCHSTCEKYIKQKSEYDTEHRNIRELKEKNNKYRRYIIDRINKRS